MWITTLHINTWNTHTHTIWAMEHVRWRRIHKYRTKITLNDLDRMLRRLVNDYCHGPHMSPRTTSCVNVWLFNGLLDYEVRWLYWCIHCAHTHTHTRRECVWRNRESRHTHTRHVGHNISARKLFVLRSVRLRCFWLRARFVGTLVCVWVCVFHTHTHSYGCLVGRRRRNRACTSIGTPRTYAQTHTQNARSPTT